ncbi:MAG: calcium/sodium antiporter [Bacteroidota bacterium]
MPIFSILLLLAGFVVLILGADKLVDGASSLAKRYNIPDIVIGLTIVAFGTSAPEMAINLVAAVKGNTDLVLGNVLGSNIFNVLAILGISAMIAPLSVRKNTVKWEIPFSLFAAVLVYLVARDDWSNPADNYIEPRDGVILLLFFGVFLIYNFRLARSHPDELEVQTHKYPLWKSFLFMILGLAGLIIGGKLIVDNAVMLATFLGVSERVIALTIVSIGTSLPELATSIVAVRKKEVDIAIGNVVGSNIFNIFLVLGLSTVAKNTAVPDASFIDIWVNIGAGILLLGFVLRGKEKGTGKWEGRNLNRLEGMAFALVYIIYLFFLIYSK